MKTQEIIINTENEMIDLSFVNPNGVQEAGWLLDTDTLKEAIVSRIESSFNGGAVGYRESTIAMLNSLIKQCALYNDVQRLSGVKLEFELHSDAIGFLAEENSGFDLVTLPNGQIYFEKFFVDVFINRRK